MKKILKYMSVGVVCVAAVLIILEFLLECLYGIPNSERAKRAIPINENEPYIVQIASRDDYYNGVYAVKDVFSGLGDYTARIDANGFIEPSKVHDEPDRTILFLGGSTTECITVSEEKRYPYLVGRMLEEETGYAVNSYNAGVGGGTSHDSLDTLIHKGLVLEPDIAVLHHNINDLIMLLKYEDYCYTKTGESYDFYWMQTAGSNPIGNGLKARLKNVWKQLFPSISGRIAALNTSKALPLPQNMQIEYDQEVVFSKFRRNLEMFISICEINDIRPVLMTQANRLGDEPDELIKQLYEACGGYELGIEYSEFWKLYEKMNDIIRTTADEYNVLCIDLEDNIENSPEFFCDMVHYTDEGSVKAANVITRELLKILKE